MQTLFKLKNKVIATSHAQISAKDGIFSLVAYVIISSSSLELLSELSTVAQGLKKDYLRCLIFSEFQLVLKIVAYKRCL